MVSMMRWSLASAIVAGTVVGCQVADPSAAPEPTGSVEQAASNNICSAVMPPIQKFIPGSTYLPIASNVYTQGYVVFQDWIHGGFIATLVDLSANKVTDAFSMTVQQVPLFMYYQSLRGRIIVPGGPPGPIPGGTKPIQDGLAWYPMNVLAQINEPVAMQNASACVP